MALSTHSRNRCRRRHRSSSRIGIQMLLRSLSFASIFVMIFSTMLSASSSVALAEDDGTECFDRQIYDDTLGMCVDDPNAMPTEDPYAEPTDDPYAEPTEDPYAMPTEDPYADPTVDPYATADVFAYKWLCPDGYDVNQPSADPFTDCSTPVDGVTFVFDNATQHAQSDTGDSIPGAVMFGGVSIGDFTLQEYPPAGTSYAFAYCAINGYGWEFISGPSLSWSLGADDELVCNWFNVPDATTTATVTWTPTYTPTPTITTTATYTPTPTITTTATYTPTPTPTDMPVDPTDATPNMGTPTTGSGSIFVYKFACPAGYDETAPGATPAADCATPVDGVTFTLTGGAFPLQTDTGDSIPGAVMFGSQPVGSYVLSEVVPVTVEHIFVTCVSEMGSSTTFTPMLTAGGFPLDLHDGETITCQWYNVPYPETGDLTIHKQDCSTETYVDDSWCTPNTTGVDFDIYRHDGTGWVYLQTVTTDATGVVALSGLLPGTFKVMEVGNVPCQVQATQLDDNGNPVSALNGDGGSLEVTNGRETVVWVSNCTGGYGDITVYKWLCPAGYDYTKPGANPPVDCTDAVDGVTFNLEQQGVGSPYVSQTDTGDSIPGAVFFGGAPAGTYTLTETVPSGIWYAFVWDCTGASTSWVNPLPLSVGNVLGIKLAHGDKIVCNWYNVPTWEPDSGDLTIHKSWCTGTTYTSDVNCDTYEGGATFDISVWNGSSWTPVTTATTNALGVIALTGLAPGTYAIAEQDGNVCHVTATQLDPNAQLVNALDDDGNVAVTDGRETVVDVYNCADPAGDPGKKPQPSKGPSKYPNTGVAPAAASGAIVAQDDDADDDTQPLIEPEGHGDAAEATTASEEIACPAIALADGVTPTPDAPIATPQEGEPCARGPVPVSIAIPGIDVDATIEVKEIVDGEMQEPSNEEVVTWYKETNRLGETGNIVMAGHLNYWGVPEAVFYDLDKLHAGDLIVVTDASGATYTYAVTSIAELPIDAGPADVVASTDTETLTLMTCGGDWDASISEYDHRTVVQAVRVTTQP